MSTSSTPAVLMTVEQFKTEFPMEEVELHGRKYVMMTLSEFKALKAKPTEQDRKLKEQAGAWVNDYRVKEMAAPEFIRGTRYREQQLRADWTGAPPELKKWAKAFVEEMRMADVPLFVHECYRSPERQRQLKAAGRSQLSTGPHNFAMAVDVVHGTRGWDLTREQWEHLGAVGKMLANRKKIKLTWGGDWRTFWDPAHWEISNWRDLAPVS